MSDSQPLSDHSMREHNALVYVGEALYAGNVYRRKTFGVFGSLEAARSGCAAEHANDPTWDDVSAKPFSVAIPEIDRLRAEGERLRQALTWVESIASNTGIGAPAACMRVADIAQRALASDEERRAHDALHGCWECGTSDMRDNVCAEHESGRRPSREQEAS